MNQNIRHLTRLEQLKWYRSFLEEQLQMYQLELKTVKEELKKISKEEDEKKYYK